MTQTEFEELCMDCVAEVRRRCPRDTGNLMTNGIQFVWLGNFKFKIYVNESIAPYMPYTNEPWISPKWNGKRNPNEAWWQDAFKLLVDLIVERLKGRIKGLIKV